MLFPIAMSDCALPQAERPTHLEAASVVVPTFNRADRLPELIERLRSQHAPELAYEIVIVDNASTDDTARLVEDAASRDPRVRYVHEREQGASAARNAGVAAARGAIVAFIDDDLVPAPDWLARLAATFAAHPEIDCLGGRIEPRWPSPPPRWLTPVHYPPLALQSHRGDATYLDAQHASACLVTANFACRRAVFERIGGFSTAFTRDEDREFNLRMWRAGMRGLYADDVCAVAIVQPERLTKRYHRKWYGVTGTNHARMRYREIIDHKGRLVPPMPGRRFFGVPGYLLRELLFRVRAWAQRLVTFRLGEAFREECHVRYLVSYLLECRRQTDASTPGRRTVGTSASSAA